MWGTGLPPVTVTGEPKLGSILIKGTNAREMARRRTCSFNNFVASSFSEALNIFLVGKWGIS